MPLSTTDQGANQRPCDHCRRDLPPTKFKPKPHDPGERYSTCRDCQGHTHALTCHRCGRPTRVRAANAKYCRPCALLQTCEVHRHARKCNVCATKFMPLHRRDHRCGRCSKPTRAMVPGNCKWCGESGLVWSADVARCLTCIKRPDLRVGMVASLKKRIHALAPVPAGPTEGAAFLRDLLGDGPRPAPVAYALGTEAGFSPRTLRREAAKVGVTKTKAGLNEGWRWSWPEAEAARAAERERAEAKRQEAERERLAAERAAANERQRAEQQRVAAAEHEAAQREQAERQEAERIDAAAGYCRELLADGRIAAWEELMAELSPMGLGSPATLKAALVHLGAAPRAEGYAIPATAAVIPFPQREVA